MTFFRVFFARSSVFRLISLCGLGLSLESPVSGAALPASAERKVDFVTDIQPIFAAHCYNCHGPSKQEAQFRLDSKDIALKGGELGPAILPGKGADSLLVQAVGGAKPDLVMPKKGERLSTEEVSLLRAWIRSEERRVGKSVDL